MACRLCCYCIHTFSRHCRACARTPCQRHAAVSGRWAFCAHLLVRIFCHLRGDTKQYRPQHLPRRLSCGCPVPFPLVCLACWPATCYTYRYPPRHVYHLLVVLWRYAHFGTRSNIPASMDSLPALFMPVSATCFSHYLFVMRSLRSVWARTHKRRRNTRNSLYRACEHGALGKKSNGKTKLCLQRTTSSCTAVRRGPKDARRQAPPRKQNGMTTDRISYPHSACLSPHLACRLTNL